MYEACKQGYKCVYAKHNGTSVSCLHPTCQVIHLDTVSIDKMTGRVLRHKSVGGKQVEK